MSYSIREVGTDHWIYDGETMTLRLRGRNASSIRACAEAYRMSGYRTHLEAFLSGVVAGATFGTMEVIAEAIGEPDVCDKGDVEARG